MSREGEKELSSAMLEELRGLLAGMQKPPPVSMGQPYESYVTLPKHVRTWIETRDERYFETLNQMVDDYRSAKTIGRAGKWLAVFIASLFGTAFAIAKGGVEMWEWIKSWGLR